MRGKLTVIYPHGPAEPVNYHADQVRISRQWLQGMISRELLEADIMQACGTSQFERVPWFDKWQGGSDADPIHAVVYRCPLATGGFNFLATAVWHYAAKKFNDKDVTSEELCGPVAIFIGDDEFLELLP